METTLRPSFRWKLRTRTLALGGRTAVMGVLNVTPDSFSDGGVFASVDAAVQRAMQMIQEGADIIDIGGESTRPGAAPVSSTEEQRRVLPVLQGIMSHCPDALISIDTYHADTARLAVETGAEIVNDVSGHLWDPRMSQVCAELGCGAVLMHTRGLPSEWKHQPPLAQEEVLPLVLGGLRQQIARVLEAGVARDRIVVDPGFGFGKIGKENYALLAEFDKLQELGLPVLAGLSRKSFLRPQTTSATVALTASASGVLAATVAANTAAILAGAHIVRVHDVAEARAAADLIDALLGRGAAIPTGVRPPGSA